ncbi:plasmid pRiA4b ORF-3 family protein [Corynebacterium sp. YIM 101645]|uniref:Plasmid pRiA4b ORF-3 family protein n=1 Tax=Corynebacterium lemuris TaxID=1859292 RepID=A0ABT2G050_9CORY|nr:plasmid pRiA4b ORF-3 family protein [Corynebacterium lemuris]MCS5480883.1 plasmid pRiA4b ORF-3 family protein [Corynebacterium lemuris]
MTQFPFAGDFDQYHDFFGPPVTPDPKLHPARSAPAGYQLRIELLGTSPQVWRRVLVPSDIHLDELHSVLQSAMGWEDAHLHRFQEKADGRSARFLTLFDQFEGQQGIFEFDVRLDEVLSRKGSTLYYDYDFGDDWQHKIKLEEITTEVPVEAVCIDGALACPPEDCGGVYGYEELAQWVRAGYPEDAVPFDLSVEEMKEWLPPNWHPDHFTAESVRMAHRNAVGGVQMVPQLQDFLASLPPEPDHLLQELLAQEEWSELSSETPPDLPAEAVEPFTQFLRVVGDGLKLTQAGRIPPAQVSELSHTLGLDQWYIGKLNREDQVYPVALLHELSRQLGFVYLRKGTLLPSKAGKALLSGVPGNGRLFADKLPLGTTRRFNEDAGWITVIVAGSGISFHEWEAHIVEVLSAIGWERSNGMMVLPAVAANPTLNALQILARGLHRPEEPEPGRITDLARLARVACRE